MTYDEWMNEIENYGTRRERFLNEWDNGMSDERMEEWLKAAYCMGMEHMESEHEIAKTIIRELGDRLSKEGKVT